MKDSGAATETHRIAGPLQVGCLPKDLLNRFIEEVRDPEGERQTRVILSCFDRIDGLSGDFQVLGQIGLRPASFRAEGFEMIVHGDRFSGDAQRR